MKAAEMNEHKVGCKKDQPRVFVGCLDAGPTRTVPGNKPSGPPRELWTDMPSVLIHQMIPKLELRKQRI